ncbi:MAG: SnoaL-like domain-containing protein [Blastochloris sp.]|nr:SnoaL-like domain-containing protein [Blastochloris sp.]
MTFGDDIDIAIDNFDRRLLVNRIGRDTASVPMTTDAFQMLMQRVAQAWSQQATEEALACFTDDAIYLEPPDIQFYQGHDQLRPYFAALQPGTFLRFHYLWFDEANQVGAGEFSFGIAGRATADHGIIVVEMRDEKIAFWREYQRKGPATFAAFIGIPEKTWQWHIGNYP